jgi:hypothetical protein
MASDASRRGVQGQRALKNIGNNNSGKPLVVVEAAISGTTGKFARLCIPLYTWNLHSDEFPVSKMPNQRGTNHEYIKCNH